MKKTKEVLRLLGFNWRALVGFEIIYKFLSMVVFLPTFIGLFNLIMKIQGYSYLTLENVSEFFLNPITILLLILLTGCMTFYAMLDIGAVIFILDQSAQKKIVYLQQIVWFTFRNAARVLGKNNILMSLVVLFLIPFLNLGVQSSLVGSISIPDFIMEYVQQKKPLFVGFLLLLFLLYLVFMRWLYSFHYFTLEHCTFAEARKKSVHLGRRRILRSFAVLLLVQFAIWLLYMGLMQLGVVLIALAGKLFAKIMVINVGVSSAIWLMLMITVLVFSALGTPVGYAAISVLYYQWKVEDGERIQHCEVPRYLGNAYRRKLIHRFNIFLGIMVVLRSLILVYGFYSGRINPQIEFVRTMEVTAHRGASKQYPENTMAAFVGAKELGADWIELDVQQSRDGQIFVMHDTSFKRTTGVNKRTWELTYDEISQLDAGSSFGEEFAGEKIPLLSEVIQFAKDNNMKLNIELKPTGHETDFAKTVVSIIQEYEFTEDCVITSQVYQVLKDVKAEDEEITTVYVMSFAYGAVNRLTAADNFSIEEASVTSSLVSRVHNAGKQLYAWTVNSEKKINRMIDRNVDNIITDNIPLAKECIYNSKLSTVVDECLKLFGY